MAISNINSNGDSYSGTNTHTNPNANTNADTITFSNIGMSHRSRSLAPSRVTSHDLSRIPHYVLLITWDDVFLIIYSLFLGITYSLLLMYSLLLGQEL